MTTKNDLVITTVRNLTGCTDSVILKEYDAKLHYVELRGVERPWIDAASIPLVKGHVIYLEVGGRLFQLDQELVNAIAGLK